MSQHAKCSPSSMSRILACPGCVAACEGLSDKTSSYAMEGSIAHFLAERCLKRKEPAQQYLGYHGWYNLVHKCGIQKSPHQNLDVLKLQVTIDEEMCEAVQVYLDEIQRVRTDLVGGKSFIEEKLTLDWLVPHVWGTADHIIVEPLGVLHAHDYKHGKGVAVDAVGNTQMRTYALMALGEGNVYGVEEVVMTIVQPRAHHSEGIIRNEVMRVNELQEWGADVLKPGVLKALAPNAERIPGDKQCKWCKALATCPMVREQALIAAQVMFTPEKTPVRPNNQMRNPKEFTSDQMDSFLEFLGMFKGLIKAVEREAYDRLQRGTLNAPATMKLVKGRKSRKWNASDKTLDDNIGIYLPETDMRVPGKMKTVAQMEKAIVKAGFDKKVLTKYVESTHGACLMVPVSDKRAAIKGRVEDMFGPVSTNTEVL